MVVQRWSNGCLGVARSWSGVVWRWSDSGFGVVGGRGENTVAISGYWPKPLTATVWAVSEKHQPPSPTAWTVTGYEITGGWQFITTNKQPVTASFSQHDRSKNENKKTRNAENQHHPKMPIQPDLVV